jgi:hypothetical protein
MAIVNEPIQSLAEALEQDAADVLYLAIDGAVSVILTLVPPDLTRCQCEWRETTAETFGPKPLVRCGLPPTVVAFQKRAHSDEPTGAMSLCDDHRVMIEHMYPNQCYFRIITPDKRIGGLA